MKIINTYPEMVSLIGKMGGVFDMGLYESYLKQISNELIEKVNEDSRIYDFDKDILPVLELAMKNPDKLEKAHDSFLEISTGLSKRVEKAIGTCLDFDMIFYLGLCNGAGWVTTLDARPTVLLGAEKIIELEWHELLEMRGLIYHEIGHVWHMSAGAVFEEFESERERYILQLYQEGIAMYFEQLLVGDFNYYHQDKNGWLDWCVSNKHALNVEYLRRLDADESAQVFFGNWCDYEGYSDVGYFLGCEFVKEMSGKYSIDELLRLNTCTVYKEFRNNVKRL